MKIALTTSACALVLALAATATTAFSTPLFKHHDATSAVSDPDPADCPFCGGNPAVHVQRLRSLERVSMALFASLLR